MSTPRDRYYEALKRAKVAEAEKLTLIRRLIGEGGVERIKQVAEREADALRDADEAKAEMGGDPTDWIGVREKDDLKREHRREGASAERAAIVEWLRRRVLEPGDHAGVLADEIEAGEHLK